MRTLLAIFVLSLLAACDRYPRTNPVDPGFEGAMRRGEDGGLEDAATDGGDASDGSDASDAAMGPQVVLGSTLVLDQIAYGPRNNENGRAEPGETLHIGVALRNDGTATARGISTSIRASSPCATARVISLTGRMDYGDIAPGSTSAPLVLVTYYEVTVGTQCTTDEALDLVLELVDASGGRSDLPLPLELAAPERAIVYASHLVDDALAYAPRNDANGRAAPGEIVRLAISLRNVGASLVRGVSATIRSESACASARTIALTGRLDYGDLEPGETSPSNTAFAYYELELSTGCAEGESIEIVLEGRDASEGSFEARFALPLAGPASDLVYASHAARDAVAFGPRNDDNGRVEPGEIVRLAIGLRNAGASVIRGVTATLRSTSSCAVASTVAADGRIAYGDLAPGETVTPSTLFSWFEAQLSLAGCVAGEPVHLVIEARDAFDRTFTLPFDLATFASDADLAYDGQVVDDDVDIDFANDGDGRVEPGERVRLGVSIRNAGTSLVRDVSAVLSSTDPCVDRIVVRGTAGRIRYGDIAPSAVDLPALDEQSFEVVIADGCARGTDIALRLDARDASNASFALPFTLRVE